MAQRMSSTVEWTTTLAHCQARQNFELAYFHALNFQEAKRVRVGGGQVLTLDQSR